MISLMRLLAAFAVVAHVAHGATVFPTGIDSDLEVDGGNNATGPFSDYPAVIKARQSPGSVDLRILPLGASIMEGLGSDTHSGLRKPLRMALRHDGYAVNMFGSRQHGSDMVDRVRLPESFK